MNSNFRAYRNLLFALSLCSLLFSSCESVQTGAGKPAEAGTVLSSPYALGRKLYFTKCADCHVAEPVRRYTREEWARIVPDMAEEAHLTAAETAAVRAYVLAELGG